MPIGGLVDGRTGKADVGGVGQPGHQKVTQVATGGPVRFIYQHENVTPFIDPGRHVAEFMDGRDDDSPIVVPEQLDQRVDPVGVLHVVKPQGHQVLAHLVFQFVAVHHQQDGGFFTFRRLEEHLRGLDHGKGLAAALGVPDQSTRASGIQATVDHPVHGQGLVLRQDVLIQFLVFLGEEDKVFEPSQERAGGHKKS